MAAMCKYVNGPFGPVVFEMVAQHSMFKSLAPTSAGAVIIRDNKITCYGNSLSLGLCCADGDSEAVAKLLGLEIGRGWDKCGMCSETDQPLDDRGYCPDCAGTIAADASESHDDRTQKEKEE